MTLGRGLTALVVLGLLGGLLSYAQRYAEAAGAVAELQRQGTELAANFIEVTAERDALRVVGDSIGLVNDSLTAAIRADVVESVELGNEARVILVERLPPEFVREVEELDDQRLASIAKLQLAATHDSATITALRAQILSERFNADEVVAADAAIIANLELQVQGYRLVAQQGWIADLRSNSLYLGIGGVFGAVACNLLCPAPG